MAATPKRIPAPSSKRPQPHLKHKPQPHPHLRQNLEQKSGPTPLLNPLSPKRTKSRLKPAFFQRRSDQVARELLGKTLVHVVNGRRLAGRIVETEAYLGVDDKAAHSYGGRRTARTESMYLAGGHCYVFLIYGMHACFNVVTGAAGVPEAVLIRALEPIDGIVEMRRLRNKYKKFIDQAGGRSSAPSAPPFDLANGPGKLCQALGIDRRLDRISLLTSAEIWIENTPRKSGEDIFITPRVGIGYAEEAVNWPLRFSLRHPVHGHKHVSKPWPCS